MQIPAPQELLDFTGKVVLVTGAGSGIGRVIALRFAQAGAAVSLHYRDSEMGAHEAADEIKKMGGRAEVVRAALRFASAAEMIDPGINENLVPSAQCQVLSDAVRSLS